MKNAFPMLLLSSTQCSIYYVLLAWNCTNFSSHNFFRHEWKILKEIWIFHAFVGGWKMSFRLQNEKIQRLNAVKSYLLNIMKNCSFLTFHNFLFSGDFTIKTLPFNRIIDFYKLFKWNFTLWFHSIKSEEFFL